MTSKEDNVLLLETMKRYNQACNYIADRIFGLYESKFWIQKQLYYDVKGIFGLPSQSVIRAISKVVEVYKRDRKIKPTFRELGAIQYDQRNSSINIDKVSITTLEKQKRLEIKTDVGEYQKSRFDKVKGQCNLIRKHGIFYIIVTRNVSENTKGFWVLTSVLIILQLTMIEKYLILKR